MRRNVQRNRSSRCVTNDSNSRSRRLSSREVVVRSVLRNNAKHVALNRNSNQNRNNNKRSSNPAGSRSAASVRLHLRLNELRDQ